MRVVIGLVVCVVFTLASSEAAEIKNLRTNKAGDRMRAVIIVENPGIYDIGFAHDDRATVFIDGLRVLRQEGAQKSTNITLGKGQRTLVVQARGPLPTLTLTKAGETRARLLIEPSASEDQGAALFGASTSSVSHIDMMSGIANAGTSSISNATPSQNVLAFQASSRRRNRSRTRLRDLRSALRQRLREIVVQNAVQNRRIARATVNGETSDYVRIGQRLTVTATPPPGQAFVRWGGDVLALEDPNAATTTLTVAANGVNVFAIFAASDGAAVPIAPANPGPTNPGPTNPGPTNPGPTNPGPTDTPPTSTPGPNPPTNTPGPNMPGPNPPAPPGAQTFALAVQNGLGAGAYAEGANVVVRPTNPPVGQTFAAWSGDTQYVADPLQPAALVTMPARSVSLTATFRATDLSVSLYSPQNIAYRRGASITGVAPGAVGNRVIFDVIGPNGEAIVRDRETSADPETGAFAARLNIQDLPTSGDVTVIVRAEKGGGEQSEASLSFPVVNGGDEIAQLLSRITYGPTPDLLTRVRQIGFDSYLEEQLNPLTIDDSEFLSFQPENLFDNRDRGGLRDLQGMSLAYAAFSRRQLQEIMANFWENHFYTEPSKNNARQAEKDEKQAFRANALGRFRDLLGISAKSPVMMAYLDNNESRTGSINENYARELMELHTVGVNSSYTEEDIIEVARILTGWGYEWTNKNTQAQGEGRVHEFVFRPEDHDVGEKTVSFLGRTFSGLSGPAGIQEGEELLDLLASHPDTAAFICGKLIKLFVSDSSKPALQERCASSFTTTGGDIKAVVRTILTSAEFRTDTANQLAKFKNPREFMASVFRSTGITADQLFTAGAFHQWGEALDKRIGFGPYKFAAPTGLPEIGAAWVGAATLVERIKSAGLFVTHGSSGVSPSEVDLFDAAPASTPEGFAVLLCDLMMLNRCVRSEYEEMVSAFSERTEYSGQFWVRSGADRALMIAVSTKSFNLQ